MKRSIKVLTAIVVAIALTIIVAIELPKGSKNEIIQIGAISPLTGPAAEYGTETRRGIELALDEINSTGGINGKPIELIYEDSKCDPAAGLSALNKLVLLNGVKIIVGTVCSSVVLAMAPIVERKNLLVISSGASTPKLSNYPDIFRTWPSDSLQGKFLGRFVATSLKLKRIAIVFIDNEYGVGLRDAFRREFESHGGTVVAATAIPEAASDVRAQLMRVKQRKPEGIFLAVFAKEMGQILKQAKEIGLKTIFFGGEGTKDPSVIDIAGDASEGLLGTVPKQTGSIRREHFLKAYASKFGNEPGITADAAYDILFLLKKSAEKCGNLEVSCIKDNLKTIRGMKGASGTISFDKNGDLASKDYELIKVKGGKFVPYLINY